MRHEDELLAKLHTGEATVGDLIDHADEIVAHPEVHGTATTQCVRMLLKVIDALVGAGEYELHQSDKLSEVLEG